MTDKTRICTYEIKEVYGRPRAYPTNNQAKLFQDLVGLKTLRPYDIHRIESLGFSVVLTNGQKLTHSMID